MSYASGTNYRSIKNYSGGRGIVSELRSSSLSKHSSVNTSRTSLNNETNKSSNSVLTVELKTYSKIAEDSAQDIQKKGENLVAIGENSLFDKAEKSKNTKNVVSEATDFVNDYNKMISSITKLGGTENEKFVSNLKKYAKENEDVLKSVGITVLKDGSLTMNRNEMNVASLENLKKVFNGKDSFADKVTSLSDDIEKNVENKLKENLLILGKSTSLSGNLNKTQSRNFFDVSV